VPSPLLEVAVQKVNRDALQDRLIRSWIEIWRQVRAARHDCFPRVVASHRAIALATIRPVRV
jgi:hypothetical protein